MDHLPVVWYHSHKAWLNVTIFTDWFKCHLVPEVISYQTEKLGIACENVKPLLLDNAPAHPAAASLVAENGHIRVFASKCNLNLTTDGSRYNCFGKEALQKKVFG